MTNNLSELREKLEQILEMYALDIADDNLEFPEEMKADKDTATEAIEQLIQQHTDNLLNQLEKEVVTVEDGWGNSVEVVELEAIHKLRRS